MKINLMLKNFILFVSLGLLLFGAGCGDDVENIYTIVVQPEAKDTTHISALCADSMGFYARSVNYGRLGADDQIYPAYVFLAPFLGNFYGGAAQKFFFNDDLFWMEFCNPAKGSEVILKMHATDICDEKTVRLITGAEDTLRFVFPVAWNYDGLRKQTVTTPLLLRWEVTVDGKNVGEYSRLFKCYPIQQYVFRWYIPKDSEVYSVLKNENWESYPDFTWNDERCVVGFGPMLMGWVEEENPLMDQLKREALDDGLMPEYGYVGGNMSDEVTVAALRSFWDLLRKRNYTYALSVALGDQYLRFPGEIIERRQGHCLESSALFASLCLSCGLDGAFVVTPGHAYVVVKNVEGEWKFILDAAIPGNGPSMAEFDQIEIIAQKSFALDKEKIAAGKLGYALIPFNDIRKGVPSINYWKGVQTRAATPDTVKMIAPDDPRLWLRRVKSDVQ